MIMKDEDIGILDFLPDSVVDYMRSMPVLGRLFDLHTDEKPKNLNTSNADTQENNSSVIALKSIMKVIEKYQCKSVFYIGKADKDIVVSIKQKCSISLADWNDVTNKQANFWWDEEDLGPYDNCPPILEWAIDVPVMIEGTPEHDLLLVDITIEDNNYLSYCDQAKIVVLFGDATLENFFHKKLYEWLEGDILLGLLKHERTEPLKEFQETEIGGRKILMHTNEDAQTVSIQLAV